MWTSSFYGNWDYWTLYHKVTFDGINKLIIINDGVTQIDIQRDIYSAWKEWVLLEINSRFEQALNTVGGEPTVAGQFLDVTYFLINGWKLKPYAGSYNLNLIGNIFDIDGGDIKISADINPLFPNNLTINTNTSVIVRQVTTDGGGGGTNGEYDADFVLLNNKLDAQSSDLTSIETKIDSHGGQLVTIDNRLISIQSILSQPIQATLVESQENILLELQDKLDEIWRIHGLDIVNPLNVTRTERTAGDISQTINTTGENETQETTITRDP